MLYFTYFCFGLVTLLSSFLSYQQFSTHNILLGEVSLLVSLLSLLSLVVVYRNEYLDKIN